MRNEEVLLKTVWRDEFYWRKNEIEWNLFMVIWHLRKRKRIWLYSDVSCTETRVQWKVWLTRKEKEEEFL